MSALEKELEAWFVSECKRRDVLCYKLISPGTRGFPDRVVIANGHCAFIELKRPKGGRYSALQDHLHKELKQHGACILRTNCRTDLLGLLAQLTQT